MEIKLLGGLDGHERKGGGIQTGYQVFDPCGLCPTLLAKGGGYGIMIAEIKVIGRMDHTIDNTHESANRVYSQYGLCPTIPTCAGGGIQPKILETKDVKQNFVSDGNGGITTGCSPEIKADETIKTIEAVYRIRKLTPTECGRLMGVDDCDIEKMKKANSNSQLYKQFGNSIVVDVMCAMFRQLNIAGVPKWNKE